MRYDDRSEASDKRRSLQPRSHQEDNKSPRSQGGAEALGTDGQDSVYDPLEEHILSGCVQDCLFRLPLSAHRLPVLLDSVNASNLADRWLCVRPHNRSRAHAQLYSRVTSSRQNADQRRADATMRQAKFGDARKQQVTKASTYPAGPASPPSPRRGLRDVFRRRNKKAPEGGGGPHSLGKRVERGEYRAGEVGCTSDSDSDY